MSLAANRSSKITQIIVLYKMGSVPSTEDLKYVLSEAIKARKPVELPFKQADNAQEFAVRVHAGTATTASKWTLVRFDDHGTTTLWTKESNEVPVIQSKIRVDSTHPIDSSSHDSATFHL